MKKHVLLVSLLMTSLFALTACGESSETQEDQAMEPSIQQPEAQSPAMDITLPIVTSDLLDINPTDYVLGDANAPVTVIEYASMSCSHCASFHNSTLPQLKEAYIDTGKVKLVLRDFPLDEPALRASVLARCAGDSDGFYKMVGTIFRTQSSWAPKENYLEILGNIGKLGGITGEQYDVCLQDETLQTQILQTKLDANKNLEIRSTPTFFVNGYKVDGAKSFDAFSSLIDAALAE